MSEVALASILNQTISFAIPLLLVALGAMYSERSGIINIAMDGIMIIGALCGCLVLRAMNTAGWGETVGKSQMGLFIAILVAGAAGILFSLLLAFAAINLKADQTIGGTALNIFAPAFCVVVAWAVQGQGLTGISIPKWTALNYKNFNIPGIQNFRDLGGYSSYPTQKKVHWGMLYRSAEIDKLKPCSRKELKNIGIRTIIDLRSSVEANRQSPLQQAFKVIHIPIPTGDMEYILKGVQEQKIKSDTVYRIVEQMNRELINNYTKEYRRIFDILLDKNNYPVVIHCSSGKGRTGIVSALVLASLGVDEDIIMEDYRLSNDYFNIPAASRYAYQLPARSQEAITTLFSAREDFLNAAIEEMERRYGDTDTYLQRGIGLTKEERKRLQDILLTDN